MTQTTQPTLLPERVQVALAATEGHTPGPWSWRGQGGSDEMPKDAYLRSDTPGTPRYIVMDFVRQGMHGAQPRLRVKLGSHSIMRPIAEIGGTWRQHPDAALMAAAPTLRALLAETAAALAAAEARVAGLRAAVERVQTLADTWGREADAIFGALPSDPGAGIRQAGRASELEARADALHAALGGQS